MYADYHIHTEFSDDSREPMENQVERAIALGLDEICFTDHVDYGIKKDWSEGNNYRDPQDCDHGWERDRGQYFVLALQAR